MTIVFTHMNGIYAIIYSRCRSKKAERDRKTCTQNRDVIKWLDNRIEVISQIY